MGHDVRPRPGHGERNKRDRRRQPRGGEGSSGRWQQQRYPWRIRLSTVRFWQERKDEQERTRFQESEPLPAFSKRCLWTWPFAHHSERFQYLHKVHRHYKNIQKLNWPNLNATTWKVYRQWDLRIVSRGEESDLFGQGISARVVSACVFVVVHLRFLSSLPAREPGTPLAKILPIQMRMPV